MAMRLSVMLALAAGIICCDVSGLQAAKRPDRGLPKPQLELRGNATSRAPVRWRPVSGASGYISYRGSKTTAGQTVMSFDLGWDRSPNMPWSKLTQADLFSLATEDGPGLDTSNLQGVNVAKWVAAAHAHHVQAMIAIGGSDDQKWQYACDKGNRAQFVLNLVSYAVTNGFDGIDIDIENALWASQGPPSEQQTSCVEAIAAAAHAATSRAGKPLWLSEDVITNWQGAWMAPYATRIDQFNLMTYGNDLATLASDVRVTHSQGVPYSKMVVGIDVDDYGEPRRGCKPFSDYAKQHDLMGAFVWDAVSDHAKAANACVTALASR